LKKNYDQTRNPIVNFEEEKICIDYIDEKIILAKQEAHPPKWITPSIIVFTFTLKLIQRHVVYSIEVLTLFNYKIPPLPPLNYHWIKDMIFSKIAICLMSPLHVLLWICSVLISWYLYQMYHFISSNHGIDQIYK